MQDEHEGSDERDLQGEAERELVRGRVALVCRTLRTIMRRMEARNILLRCLEGDHMSLMVSTVWANRSSLI
jgi:hypothetical protein